MGASQGTARGGGATTLEAAQANLRKVQNLILRPRRQVYKRSDLGPESFAYGGVGFARTDFGLTNPRGLVLECSHWQRADAAGGSAWSCSGPSTERAPCVVYCHANAGSRLEAQEVLGWALELGCSVFAFDFAGSGMSEGEHVSLGWYEQLDLQAVVEYLRRNCDVGPIAVWGRSMGAVTTLLYCDKTRACPEVSAVVLDSPFSRFDTVAASMVENQSARLMGDGCFVPGCMASPFIAMVASSIKGAAGFNPSDLDLVKCAERAEVPALFLVADQDMLVPPEQGKQLYSVYGGATGLLLFNGDHNSRRPGPVYATASKFLEPLLGLPPKARRPAVSVPLNSLRPPWEPPCGYRSVHGLWMLDAIFCSATGSHGSCMANGKACSEAASGALPAWGGEARPDPRGMAAARG